MQAPFTTVGPKTVRVKVTDVLNAASVAQTTVTVHPGPRRGVQRLAEPRARR